VKITVVGAGATGRVFAAHLVSVGADVSVLSRHAPPAASGVERADGSGRMLADAAHAHSGFAAGSDAALACVPAEAVSDDLLTGLDKLRAPIVFMMPLLPESWHRIRERLGARAVAAIPGVTGYVRSDGVVRYWLPRSAPTVIDADAGLGELATLLDASGVHTRPEREVSATNQAVTATFLPLVMALAASGSTHAALANPMLLGEATDATGEAQRLAAELGHPPGWVSLLTKFVGPRMLKLGLGLAERVSPESVDYADAQFARARLGTARWLGAELIRVAEARGFDAGAMRTLHARLVG
jgi:hypothetical protein